MAAAGRLRGIVRCLHPSDSAAAQEEIVALPSAEHGDGTPLDKKQIDQFIEEGYCLLPGIIPPELNQRLRADLDDLAADGGRDDGGKRGKVVEYNELGLLCSLPCIVEKVKQLMAACE